MEEKSKSRLAMVLIGLTLFWAVFIYGLVGAAVTMRFPEVVKDGITMVWTGRTP